MPSKTTGPSSEQTGNEKQFNSPTKSPLQTVTPNLNLSPLRKERMHVTETSVNTGNENLQANCPTKFTPETVTRNLFPSPKKSEASLKKTAKEKVVTFEKQAVNETQSPNVSVTEYLSKSHKRLS